MPHEINIKALIEALQVNNLEHKVGKIEGNIKDFDFLNQQLIKISQYGLKLNNNLDKQQALKI